VQPINTLPIQQFLTQVKNADASKAREVKITMEQAKNLAFTLGIVMSRLQGDLEKLVLDSKNNKEEVITVELNGGVDWK
jgi:plastocyanin domain-containing protein